MANEDLVLFDNRGFESKRRAVHYQTREFITDEREFITDVRESTSPTRESTFVCLRVQ